MQLLYKSLLQVHAQLLENRRRGVSEELHRLGARTFQLGGEIPAGSYVYDTGFISPEQQPIPPSRSTEAHPRGIGNRSVIFLVFGIAAIAIAVLVAFALVGANPTKVVKSQLQANKAQYSAPHLKPSPSNLQCSIDWLALKPLALESLATEGGTLWLRNDIVIGGQREQTIAFDCQGREQTEVIRFSSLDGTWKAKSATPTGSHSL